MRSYLVFAIIFLFIGLNFGCSKKADDNSNIVVEPAVYTDANLALADGTKFLDTGETEKAIEVLNQAVKLNPDLAEAYLQLGIAYALIETLDEVEGEATPEPKDTKPNSVIAFEKAVESYKKMIAANKDDHAAYFNLGRSYNKLNEDEEAAKALRQAAKLNPEDTEYQTELGAILIKLAEYREAIAPLKKALELDPSNVEAEELLEDAEAGRSRISYTSTPKEKKPDNSNTNSANANVQPPANTVKPTPPPANTAPKKTPVPTKKPN